MNGLRRGRLSWGEKVMVFGLGILGQLSVRLAVTCGAQNVVAVDIVSKRLSCLPSSHIISAFNGADLEDSQSEIAPQDLLVETSGVAKIIPDEFKYLRDQGRFLMLSSPRESTFFDFHELCNRRSIEIIGAHGFSQPSLSTLNNPWTSKNHGELFLKWLEQGRYSVNEIITHRFSYHDATEAYRFIAENQCESLAVILNWE